jgi:hypothetical protein
VGASHGWRPDRSAYKRDTLTTSQGPNIIGWHRHQLGSGRLVESICVGPSVGGNLDTLSLITNDANTGVRHIEMMTDLLDEGFALTDCWFLDDAIAPSSTVVQLSPTGGAFGSLVVNGLAAHEGKTVTAFIAGLDCGDFAVSSGSITSRSAMAFRVGRAMACSPQHWCNRLRRCRR